MRQECQHDRRQLRVGGKLLLSISGNPEEEVANPARRRVGASPPRRYMDGAVVREQDQILKVPTAEQAQAQPAALQAVLERRPAQGERAFSPEPSEKFPREANTPRGTETSWQGTSTPCYGRRYSRQRYFISR